jgi:hypothetical protein
MSNGKLINFFKKKKIVFQLKKKELTSLTILSLAGLATLFKMDWRKGIDVSL